MGLKRKWYLQIEISRLAGLYENLASKVSLEHDFEWLEIRNALWIESGNHETKRHDGVT
jgi:hypothetical protein